MYSWGSGVYGELGNGEFNDSNLPKLVMTFKMAKSNLKEDKKQYDHNYLLELIAL
jgi:alpha-tubulin suppressor-like RCC1 family protein